MMERNRQSLPIAILITMLSVGFSGSIMSAQDLSPSDPESSAAPIDQDFLDAGSLDVGSLDVGSGVQTADWESIGMPNAGSEVAPVQYRSPVFPSSGRRDWLQLDTLLSDRLLDFQNRQTDKELFILQHGRAVGCTPKVIGGGQARLSFLAAATNTDSKFPYLGRFPTDFHGDTATDARLLQGNTQLTAYVAPAISVYGELLFSDVFSFGDFKQGSLQVRQAYAILGDLDVSPFYFYLGKKNIGFGDFGTLSPFTQAVTWHYFAALAEGLGVGYHDDSWDLTLAAINGGRGIRVNDSTERGKLNNFAANLLWHRGNSPTQHVQAGGGFLLGTIYDGLTAEHLDQNQFGSEYNSAWNVNGRVDLGRWTMAGEFVSTTGPWPVTGSLVSAYRTEAAYWIDRGDRPSYCSASWSDGKQGPAGSEFEFNRQLVLGYSKVVNSHVRVSAEYVRSLGFAPLIDITTVSDRDVVQDSMVLGMTIVL
jgi:hypothetical protein